MPHAKAFRVSSPAGCRANSARPREIGAVTSKAGCLTEATRRERNILMRLSTAAMAALLAMTAPAAASPFQLLTGVDVGKYPGTRRTVNAVPGPSFAGAFDDGDRLAGTSDTGGDVFYVGSGQPVIPPNNVGAFSFLFRRGSVPAFPFFLPLMGIDYLGGPLLDLDGNTANGTRSYIPVSGQNAVAIPGSSSFIDLTIDTVGGTITLNNFDATGTAEGAPGFDGRIAVTLVTIAGTSPTGAQSGPINPAMDTRVGTLTAYLGISGTLTGVHRVHDLGYELWYDSISPDTGTPQLLGTIQHLGKFRGWVVERDCATGQFPTLAGQGLGVTLWPQVDPSQIGAVWNTAINVFGPTATIEKGFSTDDFATGDDFTMPNNGGIALTDAGGDIGAYFDTVVVPHLDPAAQSFVYLESAGFGINNSGDPVFTDTIGYDVVVVAQSTEAAAPLIGDIDGNGLVEFADADDLVAALLDPSSLTACDANRADVNQDTFVNGLDVQAFVDALL